MSEDSEVVRFLLIDEDRFSRAYLRSALARRPRVQVLEAENALQGLELLARQQVDAIIMELVMTDLDGMAMLQLIRSHPPSARVEIAIASSHTLEANVRRAIELGVTDYLVKPFQPADVERRLSTLLQRTERTKRLKSDPDVTDDKHRVLVADNDLNFCSFALSTLGGRYSVKHAVSSLEILVGISTWSPDLLLLNSNLRGLNMDLILNHIQSLGLGQGMQIYLLGAEEDLHRPTDRRVCGWVQRTFVPKLFSALVAGILEPTLLTSQSAVSWLGRLEPEIISAVRQVFGMMTREEPASVDAPDGWSPDVCVSLNLRSRKDRLCLVLELNSSTSLGTLLAAMLTGMPQTEIDQELIGSGLGEVLNVVGGRLMECCRAQDLHLNMGLPEVGVKAAVTLDALFCWHQHFQWRESEIFRLSLTSFPDAGTR